MSDLKKLKVAELREELDKYGVPHKGLKKAELVAKLEETLAAQEKVEEEDVQEEVEEEEATEDASAEQSLEDSASGTVVKIGGDTAADLLAKKKARAAKFGIQVALSEEEKKALRAAKFGTAAPQSTAAAGPIDAKLAARAKRFGTTGAGSAAAPAEPLSAEEVARRQARLERFGPVDSALSYSMLKKNKGKGARKGGKQGGNKRQKNNKGKAASAPKPVFSPEEEEKRRKRAERFGLST